MHRVTFVGRFFLLVTVLGFAELYLLVKAASGLGFLETLGLCILTGIIGGAFVRSQGLRTLGAIQQASAEGRMPATEMISGLTLLLVGVLLIVPGFLTDLLGFVMLIPPLRMAAARAIARRFEGRVNMHMGAAFAAGAGAAPESPESPESTQRSGGKRKRKRARGRVIDIEADDSSPTRTR